MLPTANVAAFEGRKMFVGIGRITAPEKTVLEEQPHFDSLPPDLTLDGQFSANVYLKVPEHGGELDVWNHPTLSPDEIHDDQLGRDWRSMLPPPIRIRPAVGDLILINTRKPHAVCSFARGERVSIQCFIGYKRGRSLALWC